MNKKIQSKINSIELTLEQILTENGVKSHYRLKFGEETLKYESLLRIKLSLQDMITKKMNVQDVLQDLTTSPSFNAMNSDYCNKKRKIVLDYFKVF